MVRKNKGIHVTRKKQLLFNVKIYQIYYNQINSVVS
jgi:hypothetical protein